MRKFWIALVALFLPAAIAAQDLGNVGLRTVSATLANGTTCTGAPQNFITSQGIAGFQNLGQFAHQASAISSAASFSLEIDGVDNNGVAVRISNPQVSFVNGASTSYIAQGSGYYTNIQVSVTCTVSATFTLSYNASFGTGGSITGAPSSNTFITNGLINQVQGIVSQQQGGQAVDPVITGGLQPAVNGGLLNVGFDNASSNQVSVPAGTSGTIFVGTTPAPTQKNELAILVDGNQGDLGTTAGLAPWTQANTPGGGQFQIWTLANPKAGGQPFFRSYTNSTPGGVELSSYILFQTPNVSVRAASFNTAASNPISYTVATLAGSALVVAIECAANTTPCTVSGLTDTQGHTFVQVAQTNTGTSSNIPGISTWIATTVSTAGADSVTATFSVGASRQIAVMEIPAVAPASLTQPAISNESDQLGAQVIRQDALGPNQFVLSATLSTNTTTQIVPAPTTIAGVAVRAYVTDFQINTTTAGTATTIQIKTGTGTNCGSVTANLSAITYPNTAVGLQTIVGFRTPFVAPLQSAVCATQAGTTAGTSVVEVHGYLAP